MSETTPQSSVTSNVGLASLLEQMVAAGASDLHLGAGTLPAIRVDVRIQRLEGLKAPKSESMQALLDSILSADQRAVFERTHDIDFAYSQLLLTF